MPLFLRQLLFRATPHCRRCFFAAAGSCLFISTADIFADIAYLLLSPLDVFSFAIISFCC